MPTGPVIAQPLSLLDSPDMARFLTSLRDDYDFVVLDCPPADAADFLALSRVPDGVVAIDSGIRTNSRAAEDFRQRLDVHGHLLGGIFIARGRGPGGRRSHLSAAAEQADRSVDVNQADGAVADRDGRASSADGATRQSSSEDREDLAVDESPRATRQAS